MTKIIIDIVAEKRIDYYLNDTFLRSITNISTEEINNQIIRDIHNYTIDYLMKRFEYEIIITKDGNEFNNFLIPSIK